jgi:hypothetical protein
MRRSHNFQRETIAQQVPCKTLRHREASGFIRLMPHSEQSRDHRIFMKKGRVINRTPLFIRSSTIDRGHDGSKTGTGLPQFYCLPRLV